MDQHFLIDTHKDVIPEDEFTRKMVNCYLAVKNAGGPKQTVVLLTQRGDYMCHTGDSDVSKELSLKQVNKIVIDFNLLDLKIEVNNIAVSMGGLAQKASLLHRRILQKLGVSREEIASRTPDNRPIDLLADGLHKAW